MTYDATAQQLAVKVIGTVESNLDYEAVNYGDPITVGIAQWYGVRAAAVLCRMRNENGPTWYGIEPSIDSQLALIPSTDGFWNSRRLTYAEGSSLLGVMGRNHGIQNDQLTIDLDAYKQTAINLGMSPDANTAAMIFFFTMYHQGPAYAQRILAAAGPAATLDTLYNTCLTHVDEVAGTVVLGQYGARYRTAHDMIAAGDVSGIAPPPPPPAAVPNGNAKYIQSTGDNLLASFQDGERLLFYPNGSGMFTPRAGATAPTPVQPPPPVTNTTDWVCPLVPDSGSVVMSSGYGPRSTPSGTANINGGFHYGCDFIPNSGGATVVAPCPMVVTVAYDGVGPDPSSGTAGRYVKGHAVDGTYTFNFFHMVAGSIVVTVGDTLTRGQKIGVMGGTGNVTGPHLHFETYPGVITSPWPPPYGSPVDPIPVLRDHGVAL